IRNGSNVHKWPEFHCEESVPVNVLIHFPVSQKISTTERRCSLAPMIGSGMSAQPQIVVALDAQLKEFIERKFTLHISCAHLRLHLVIVALRLRKPVRIKRSLHTAELTNIVGTFATAS